MIDETRGPLHGLTVVEAGGIGAAPFAGMLLADLGADVVRVDHPEANAVGIASDVDKDVLLRGKRSIRVDLKSTSGRQILHVLAARSDVFIEGFRPGVVGSLGLGPAECLSLNPRLIYCQLTGWGQVGPLRNKPGYDLNFIARSGALHALGDADDAPPVPLVFLGDFAGGGLLAANGILAALHHRQSTGEGQVLDCSMRDGAALLTAAFHGLKAMGAWSDERKSNVLDGGAPFYSTYKCLDGKFVAVAALTPHLYESLLGLLGLRPQDWPQDDRTKWLNLHAAIQQVFMTAPRDEWVARSASEACPVDPVLSLDESLQDSHALARGAVSEISGVLQPSPSPAFSVSKTTPGPMVQFLGQHTRQVLNELDYEEDLIEELVTDGVVS